MPCFPKWLQEPSGSIQSQQPGTPILYSTWAAGTGTLGSSFSASFIVLSECWNESRASQAPTDTETLYACVTVSGFHHFITPTFRPSF